VDGKPAYKLTITDPSGAHQHVWVDVTSFLDVKVDGVPRRMDGKPHNVFITQRDFRSVQGLMLPFEQVTTVEGYPESHKMIIEKVSINTKFDDALFGKPQAFAAIAPGVGPALTKK
jgi:hypothetical protein